MSIVRVLRSWAWPWELRRNGVLGVNNRNLSLLFELNPRSRYPLVDDKVLTKALCAQHGVPVPRTLSVVRHLGDVRDAWSLIDGHSEFVIKPARGAGGRGVLVAERKADGSYRKGSGDPLPEADIRHHLSSILSGLYSLGGRPDRAIVEERIFAHQRFARISYRGTPDVRVIVYRERPVMAMVRLPTRESDGRANLHQGAVAAGIDLDTGRTIGGVHRDRAVSTHPDTGDAIAGIAIPYWPQILDISVRLARALQLGYVGVDIVPDDVRGPVVLEANARPGLAIQIANGRGLLEAISRLPNASRRRVAAD